MMTNQQTNGSYASETPATTTAKGRCSGGARTPAQLRMAVRAYFGAVAIMVLVPLVVWMLTGHPAAFSSAMTAPVFLVLGIQAYRELRAATRSS